MVMDYWIDQKYNIRLVNVHILVESIVDGYRK